MSDGKRLGEAFAKDLGARLGERVRALALFGSAARGEWISGLSDVNVLVLVDDVDAALLARAAPQVQASWEHGVRPLVMELEEWRRAADVFAIELADMRDAHVPLAGADPLDGLAIDPLMVRLQAERELRAKLLHLHQGMLMGAGDPGRLGELLVRSLPSFTTYLRAALRLAGEPVPAGSAEVIERGCRLAGADPGAYLRVLGVRQAGGALKVGLDEALVEQFNSAAERLAAFIDAIAQEARREPS